MERSKRHYAIYHNGYKVGESWAVSAQKAVTNYWWCAVKYGNKYHYGHIELEELEAVEI